MVQLDNAVERYNKLILAEMKEVGIICWIAGGAIRDYFMGVKINTDYDLFFPDEVNYEKAKIYLKEKDAVIKWESDKGMKVVHNKKTFDLVKHFFSTPKETINAFDFTVSMFAVDSEKVYYGETTFIDLAKRQLMFNKITYPASTLSRSFRYYKKGFLMCAGEMKKLVEAIQNMPKKEPELPEEPEKESSGDTMNFFMGID